MLETLVCSLLLSAASVAQPEFLTAEQQHRAELALVPPPDPELINPTVPLRDLVDIRGVRENQLVGYGLIVGLAGTGDGTQARFTIQSIANALQRMGVSVPPNAIRVRNAAAVMVTANLPAFSRPGARIDTMVASIGDAKSLTGGVLLMTPLRGADGQIYALAQGPISLGGGFSASGGGASVTKNHATAGVIPGGGLVERDVPVDLNGRTNFDLQLRRPDFATARRIEAALGGAFDPELVHAVDAGTVRLTIPETLRDRPVEYLAAALGARVTPDTPAKVVLNERTGTVVLGGDVRIGRVAVTHGNLTISVVKRLEVSQPQPFSTGETTVVPRGEVVAEEAEAQGLSLPEGARVEDLISSLKKLGVTPRDMIAIFQAIRAAGALHAEVVVI
jgi:flagellar P-ring protein precursor FlgI